MRDLADIVRLREHEECKPERTEKVKSISGKVNGPSSIFIDEQHPCKIPRTLQKFGQ